MLIFVNHNLIRFMHLQIPLLFYNNFNFLCKGYSFAFDKFWNDMLHVTLIEVCELLPDFFVLPCRKKEETKMVRLGQLQKQNSLTARYILNYKQKTHQRYCRQFVINEFVIDIQNFNTFLWRSGRTFIFVRDSRQFVIC